MHELETFFKISFSQDFNPLHFFIKNSIEDIWENRKSRGIFQPYQTYIVDLFMKIVNSLKESLVRFSSLFYTKY